MAPKRTRQAWGAVVALTLVIAAACTASDGADPSPDPPRPVTVKESKLLAELRMRNADAGSRAISATYPDHGRETTLTGWFDYSTRTGYATVSADGLPSGSPLAVVLTVLAGLGSDRPDDARLIRQGGALWLREDETGGTPVTVFAGPAPSSSDDDESDGSPIRYWVDDDGLAHRVDVRLGDEWAEVTFENDDVPVPPLLSGVDLEAEGGVAAAETASG